MAELGGILGLELGMRWGSAKHDIDGHTSLAPKHEMKWHVTRGGMDTGVVHHAHLQCLCRINSRMFVQKCPADYANCVAWTIDSGTVPCECT